MFTPPTGTAYIEPSIFVNGVKLEAVNTFVYLGSTMSRDGTLAAEITHRIEKASIAFGRFEERIWSDRDLKIETKIVVYVTCVICTPICR